LGDFEIEERSILFGLLAIQLVEVAYTGKYNTVGELVDIVQVLLYDTRIDLDLRLGIVFE